MIAEQPGKLFFMSNHRGKSLTVLQNERVLETVRKLLAKYDNNQSELARKLGVTQATISALLSGKSGAGNQLIEALMRVLHVTRSQLVDGLEESQPSFGSAVGWAEAEQLVRQDLPGIPAWAWDSARSLRGISVPSPVTKDFVANAVLFVMNSISDDQKYELAKAAMDATVKRINSTAETRRTKSIAKKAEQKVINDSPKASNDQ